ncbi:MAG: type II toxin-antitoxin system VapC family toxin [Spirochaetes bacterium]|nr:type II toxin-antitoxin system VapC family toxin [Spirochaetota bacterium]
MNYIVDTHILLWSFIETKNLSKKIKSVLLDENNEIYYSPISLWEISLKYGLKKLSLKGGTPDDFFEELKNSYYHCKIIDDMDLITSYKLPTYHKDPFDETVEFLIFDKIFISI